MKFRLLILFCSFCSITHVFGQKEYAFRTVDLDSVGYTPEASLLSDALVWKVGGNMVTAHSIIGTNAAYDLIFRTNSTERMRILANGNVGIGVTAPTHALDVNGNVTIINGTLSVTDGGDGNEKFGLNATTTSGFHSTAIGASAAANGVYSTAVGWGSTTSAFGTAIGVNATCSGTYSLAIGYNASNAGYNASTVIGANAVNTSNNQLVMGASQAGYDIRNVVIGMGSENDLANAYGGIRITGTNGLGANINGANMAISGGRGTGTGLGGSVSLMTSAAGTTGTSLNTLVNRLHVTSGGNIGINTTSPQKTLQVNGEMRIATLASGTSTDSTVTVDANGDLRKRKTSDLITATPTLSSVLTAGNSTGSTNIDVNAIKGIGYSTSTTFSRYSENLLRHGLTFATKQDAFSAGNYTTTLSGYGGINFATNDSVYARLRYDGNFGLGTQNPNARLTFGGATMANGTSNMIRFKDAGSAITSESGDDYGIGFRNSDGRVAFTSGNSGYFSFFTGNSETLNLSNSGDLTLTGDITAFGGSFSNAVSVGNPVLGGDAVNRSSADARYLKQGGTSISATLYNGTTTNYGYAIVTNGVERVHVDTLNRVGIATASPNSNLSVNGSMSVKVTSISTSSNTTTAGASDYLFLYTGNTSSNTLTLPAASTCAGRVYKVINNSANVISISTYTYGDGLTSSSLTATFPNNILTVVSDGTNWHRSN